MQGARHQHVTPGESSHSGSFTPIVLCRSHCSRTTDISPLQPKGLRVRVSRGAELEDVSKERAEECPQLDAQHPAPPTRIQGARSALQGVLHSSAQLPLPLLSSLAQTLLTPLPLSPPLPFSLPTGCSAMDRKELQSPAIRSQPQDSTRPHGRQAHGPPTDSPL